LVIEHEDGRIYTDSVQSIRAYTAGLIDSHGLQDIRTGVVHRLQDFEISVHTHREKLLRPAQYTVAIYRVEPPARPKLVTIWRAFDVRHMPPLFPRASTSRSFVHTLFPVRLLQKEAS
jgi:hypothetical protein